MIMPGGEIPRKPIPLTLRCAESSNYILLTSDSKGRAVLPELQPQEQCYLTIPTDGKSYGTILVVLDSRSDVVRVPLPRLGDPARTVSASALREPKREAVKLYRKGLALLKKGHAGPAEEALRQAIGLDSCYVAPRMALASVQFAAKRFAETEETLIGVLSLDSRDQKAKLQLGIVRCMAGRFQHALEPLREVLQSEQHPASAHLYLGIALLEMGRLAEAEAEFNEVFASSDGDAATTHYCLGRLHAKAGKLDKSVRSFEAFLNLRPDAREAKAIRATIERMKSALPAGPL